MSAAHATDPLPSPTVPVDEVVATRRGEVLIKSTILKSDHFPGAAAAIYSGHLKQVGQAMIYLIELQHECV